MGPYTVARPLCMAVRGDAYRDFYVNIFILRLYAHVTEMLGIVQEILATKSAKDYSIMYVERSRGNISAWKLSCGGDL